MDEAADSEVKLRFYILHGGKHSAKDRFVDGENLLLCSGFPLLSERKTKLL